MDWGAIVAGAIVVVLIGYEVDKVKDLLTDIRDSLRNIESHLTEDDDD